MTAASASDAARRARGFDRLAPAWDVLASVLSGGAIPRSQVRFLDAVRGSNDALVVGGGSGRFVVDLVGRAPAARVLALDPSAGMLRRTALRVAARAPHAAGRVEYCRGTVDDLPVDRRFDLVCTHFVLDLFAPSTLERVMARLDRALAPGGAWLCADFAPPAGAAARRAVQRVVLSGLYAGFGAACAIEARRLPPIESAFRGLGYRAEAVAAPAAGLLRTAVYRRAAGRP